VVLGDSLLLAMTLLGFEFAAREAPLAGAVVLAARTALWRTHSSGGAKPWAQ
jgi:hypothetical protein